MDTSGISMVVGETDIKVRQRLESIPLNDVLYAFRLTTTTSVIDRVGTKRNPVVANESVNEGVCDAGNLKKMTKGRDFTTIPMVVFPDDLIEDIRVRGRHVPFEGASGAPNRFRRDVFTALTRDSIPVRNVVRTDASNYVFFDVDGLPLPVGLKCDYMNGRFSDRQYDLEKAAAHLLTRSDVKLYAPSRSISSGDEKEDTLLVAANAKEAIFPIPYYNSESGARQLRFRWIPTLEDYRRVADIIGLKKLGLTSRFYEAIFEIDLFGLRAAGCSLSDRYYRPSQEEDEDG